MISRSSIYVAAPFYAPLPFSPKDITRSTRIIGLVTMTWWGIDDLRGYMKDAVLPELKYGGGALALPPSGHKSHRNTLSTRFRKERHLTSIECLDNTFDNLVHNC